MDKVIGTSLIAMLSRAAGGLAPREPLFFQVKINSILIFVIHFLK
jgi:hypothetical protein